MKRLIPILIAIGVLFGIGVFVLSSTKTLGDNQAENSPASEIKKSAPIPQGPPLPVPEKDSLLVSVKQMAQVLAAHAGPDKKLEDLIEEFKNTRQEPYIVRDANKYTGEMVIVRSKNPPPGTRYFHAQYFQDEDQSRFPQHMSFEFRPHAEAMDQAIAAVHDAFPNLGNPEQQAMDFIQWDLGNGHVLWIKRLGYEDIEGNPFNAYTEADVGSIRVAVELRLEGH